MKKILAILFIALFALTACQSEKLNLTEVNDVPKAVQEHINPDVKLQAIHDDEGTYIVFNSGGNVKAKLDTEEDVAIVKFDVKSSKDSPVKQYIYYLTTGENHGAIDIHVDGKSTSFDEVTSM